MHNHRLNTSLKLAMRAERECPCRSSSSRLSILPSWALLSSSSNCRIDDSSRYLLASPLFWGLSTGASSLGPSSTFGRSSISSFSSSLNGCSTFSTVNSAMYRFCFSRISSRLAVVKNSIQLAMAMRVGGKERLSTLRLSSELFSSLMLLRRVSNWSLYSRLMSWRSFLLSSLTISRSISKAVLRQTSQHSRTSSCASASVSSSGASSRNSSKPQQRKKKSFSLHSKRNFCILESQMEGRYMLLYWRQCSSMRRLMRPDFSLSARSCASVLFSLPTLRSSLEAFLGGGLGAVLALLRDSLRLSSISWRSRSSFSICSLNILRISSWLMRLSDLVCTICSSSPSSSAGASRTSPMELMDWKLGTEDMGGLRLSGSSLWGSCGSFTSSSIRLYMLYYYWDQWARCWPGLKRSRSMAGCPRSGGVGCVRVRRAGWVKRAGVPFIALYNEHGEHHKLNLQPEEEGARVGLLPQDQQAGEPALQQGLRARRQPQVQPAEHLQARGGEARHRQAAPRRARQGGARPRVRGAGGADRRAAAAPPGGAQGDRAEREISSLQNIVHQEGPLSDQTQYLGTQERSHGSQRTTPRRTGRDAAAGGAHARGGRLRGGVQRGGPGHARG